MTRVYDRIAVTYRATRHTEPRIAAAILDALGDARTVVNVGAGTELLAFFRGAGVRIVEPSPAVPSDEGLHRPKG